MKKEMEDTVQNQMELCGVEKYSIWNEIIISCD